MKKKPRNLKPINRPYGGKNYATEVLLEME